MIVQSRHHAFRDTFHLLQHCVPALVMAIWLCLSNTMLAMPSLTHFWPPLSFGVIFFCAGYAPRLLPYSFLLLMGIAYDALALQPIALTAIQYMALRILITTQGRLLTSLPFWMQWAVFSMSLLTLLLIQWIVMGLHHNGVFPLSFAFLPWLSATALYPLIHRTLYPIYTRIVTYEKVKQGWM